MSFQFECLKPWIVRHKPQKLQILYGRPHIYTVQYLEVLTFREALKRFFVPQQLVLNVLFVSSPCSFRLRNYCVFGFRPSLEKRASLKFQLDLQKFLVQFFVCFQSFTEKTLRIKSVMLQYLSFSSHGYSVSFCYLHCMVMK